MSMFFSHWLEDGYSPEPPTEVEQLKSQIRDLEYDVSRLESEILKLRQENELLAMINQNLRMK